MRPELTGRWRFLDSGPGDAAFNMALDEALLRSVAAGASPPVLRVYRWSGPSVSLGYSQRAERELDRAACFEAGIQVVRRITGGRAVWHEDELTYSFCAPTGTDHLGRTISESWLRIARGIRSALSCLGVESDLAAGEKDSARGAATRSANPCFSSATRHEIAFQGRKLVGSAQRRVEGAFLQQGSLLLSNCQGRLLDYLPPWVTDETRARMRAALEKGVAGLDFAAGRRISYDEAAAAFHLGFAQAFDVSLEPVEPSPEELRQAARLARARYSNPDWPGLEKGDPVI